MKRREFIKDFFYSLVLLPATKSQLNPDVTSLLYFYQNVRKSLLPKRCRSFLIRGLNKNITILLEKAPALERIEISSLLRIVKIFTLLDKNIFYEFKNSLNSFTYQLFLKIKLPLDFAFFSSENFIKCNNIALPPEVVPLTPPPFSSYSPDELEEILRERGLP